ncbi:MAG: type II secretion system protein [Burkholderiales bacterium]
MASRNRQEGLAAATVVIVIILAVMALALGRGAFQREAEVLDQRGATDARLRKIQDALVAYAVLKGRLPCPAVGNPGTGDAAPDAPTTACTAPDGVVPWRTLALRREDALDGWNRQISYRVFDGVSGFTQDGGVNMTNCNSSLGFPLDLALGPGALCKAGAPPPNMPLQFLAVRGNMLVVDEMGTARNGNAIVLVSHGETGYGAFPADGTTGRLTLPNNAGREYTNTQAGGTYWMLPRSAPATPAGDAGHFDDVVTYLGAQELAARAKLGARPWSEYSLTATFSQPAVAAAAPGLVGENTGQAYLGMGGFLVIGTDSTPGARNLGIRTEDGITGLGVIGGGSSAGDLNSAFGERLTFVLGSGSQFQKMDIAMNRFRVVDLGPPRLEERAEVSFWRGGDLLQTSTVTSWVVDPVIRPARCLFGLVPSAVYDRVDVRPVSRNGDGGQTTFTVAEIQACAEATAVCTTAVPNALDCPDRAPSAASTRATGIAMTAATVEGLAHDNGAATTVSFDYGTTCAYPSNAAATPANLSAGDGETAVSASLTGLACNTSYYFRTKAVSAGGTTTGNDAMFTTAACPISTPLATTNPASDITQTSATLKATVHDNGSNTTVSFDHGPSNCYGSSLVAAPGTIIAGAGATPVTATLTGLACNTRYHYRVRAVTATATTTAGDVAFTTAPCP